MKSIFKTTMVASVAALSLGLAGCDSAAENEMEDDAEVMEDNMDTEIESMEETGEITDAEGDAMEDAVDEEAEAMEEAADTMDVEPT